MKTHPTQYRVRENTASQRQHDLRPATAVPSRLVHTKERDPNTRISPPENESQATDFQTELHAGQQRAATDEREASQLLTVVDVADMLQVPVSWVYGRMRKRSREQLPGYRLGKYWRFREREVLEWVRCHRGGSHAA
jgi:predicted DNA-binding transcriptional regulator AlpA